MDIKCSMSLPWLCVDDSIEFYRKALGLKLGKVFRLEDDIAVLSDSKERMLILSSMYKYCEDYDEYKRKLNYFFQLNWDCEEHIDVNGVPFAHVSLPSSDDYRLIILMIRNNEKKHDVHIKDFPIRFFVYDYENVRKLHEEMGIIKKEEIVIIEGEEISFSSSHKILDPDGYCLLVKDKEI